MRKVDINETFPISIGLEDDLTSYLISGQEVYYQLRTAVGDFPLSPAISGTLVESTIEPGVYKTVLSIPESGLFVFYATCSGFLSYSEEITVNPEDIYKLVKQERQYNLSVEDVPRLNITPSPSQTLRKVPLNRTDYVISKIKNDDDIDWSNPAASGVVYAWYRNDTDDLPYLMGDAFGNTSGATVSGIYPGSVNLQSGNYTLTSGTITADITFNQPFVNTTYGLSVNLVNTIDNPPSIYPYIITSISNTGFSIEFSGNIDSSNYFIKWMALM